MSHVLVVEDEVKLAQYLHKGLSEDHVDITLTCHRRSPYHDRGAPGSGCARASASQVRAQAGAARRELVDADAVSPRHAACKRAWTGAGASGVWRAVRGRSQAGRGAAVSGGA